MEHFDKKLIGPFSQILTLSRLPMVGPIADEQMEILEHGGIVSENGRIIEVDNYRQLEKKYRGQKYQREYIHQDLVALPGLIDAHTHLCYAGSRANDYAKRIAGKTYLQIAEEGGGIWQTVEDTRNASNDCLEYSLKKRVLEKLRQGVTTIEIKSGYGLNKETEIRQLEIIDKIRNQYEYDLIPTCLAAHMRPKDFPGTNVEYLSMLINELLPEIQSRKLAKRIDVFVENGAFSADEASWYLKAARKMGFDLVMHADQFSKAGSHLAAELGILSADHLEASGSPEIQLLHAANVICTVLPGASLGLGMPFAPARKILDHQACLVIASDQNPGSAPHGNLLTLASIMATFEKLTTAEVFAAITYRAAAALRLSDRGVIASDKLTNLVAFPTRDYREILYQQGNLKPCCVWKKGVYYNFSLLDQDAS
jgi:imidazolonepropionase